MSKVNCTQYHSMELKKLIEFTTQLEFKTWAFDAMSEDNIWYETLFSLLLEYGLYVPCIKLMVEYMIDDQENLKKELHSMTPQLESDVTLHNRARKILHLLSMHNIKATSLCDRCYWKKNIVCTLCGKNPQNYSTIYDVIMCSTRIETTVCERAYCSVYNANRSHFFAIACTCAKN